MKKIAIVCDSSVSFSKEELKRYDVYIVPNVILHNEKAYLDQKTITKQEINDLIESKEKVTTSQPNLGDIVTLLEKIKKEEYDHVFIITISSALSGGYNAFVQASKIAELSNVSVVDSFSIGGVVQQAVKAVRKMNAENKSLKEIKDYLSFIFNNSTTYLFPKSLDQIIASGRVSKTTGKLASLLKIKTAVYFKKGKKSIEKFAVARTEKKIFSSIIKDLEKYNVNPKDYDLYFLQNKAKEQIKVFQDQLSEQIGEFKNYISDLPAALSVHAGSKALVIQWCPKIK